MPGSLGGTAEERKPVRLSDLCRMGTALAGPVEKTVLSVVFLVFSTAVAPGQLKKAHGNRLSLLLGSQPRTYHRHQRNRCGAPSADRRCRRGHGLGTVVSGVFNLQPAPRQGSAALGASGLHGQGTHPRFGLGFAVAGKLPVERSPTFSLPLV